MPDAKLDLDQRGQQVYNLFKFRNFCDQMDITTDQGFAITNEIIELHQLSGGSDVAKKLPCGRTKVEDDAVVFYK